MGTHRWWDALMAPKTTTVTANVNWYLSHYDPEKYKVVYEMDFAGDLIKPGDLINVKHQRDTYKFRCLVHHYASGKSWFDCLLSPSGASNLGGSWHSFDIERLKGKVKPKRVYRKRK